MVCSKERPNPQGGQLQLCEDLPTVAIPAPAVSQQSHSSSEVCAPWLLSLVVLSCAVVLDSLLHLLQTHCHCEPTV